MVILIKLNTETKTSEIIYEPKDIGELSSFGPDYIIAVTCKYFNISDIKTKCRAGKYAQSKIIASVLLEEFLSLPNNIICELIGYSTKKNSSNVVSRNKRLIEDKDALYYPLYLQVKKKLWINLGN